MSAQLVLTAILVAAIVWQAFLPKTRLTGVTVAAALACVSSAVLGGASPRVIFAQVPWDVLVILVALGALSAVFAEARVFQRVAVGVARLSRGDPRRFYVVVALTMYIVSGLVNNLTALLLVLPVIIVILRLLTPDQRYTSWTLGLMLVACNLGGAATPIGDFPAIVLLGAGRMEFLDYLAAASWSTATALGIIVLIVLFLIRPARRMPRDELTRRITLRVAESMHRGVRVDRRVALPAFVIFVAMLCAWVMVPPSSGVGPDLIAWSGAGLALLAVASRGERVLKKSLDPESMIFLLALFIMVGSVRSTGLFEWVGQTLVGLPVRPSVRLVIFLVCAAALTGVFSAGPSMAALLEVADVLAHDLDPNAVYVGLALSVCAGSSLFLTAATSGPLAQALVERADLRDARGSPLVFGFREFVPVGLLCFTVILGVGITQALIRIS